MLIPYAWILCIINKSKAIQLSKFANKTWLMIDLLLFVILGPVILVLNTIVDSYYFWMNNFRSDLEKCVIKKHKIQLSHKSIKMLLNWVGKQVDHKVETVRTRTIVRNFRRKLAVVDCIQNFIFGQDVK